MKCVGYLSLAASVSVSLASCGKNSKKSTPVNPELKLSEPKLEPADTRKLASQLAATLRGGRPLPPEELKQLKGGKIPDNAPEDESFPLRNLKEMQDIFEIRVFQGTGTYLG